MSTNPAKETSLSHPCSLRRSAPESNWGWHRIYGSVASAVVALFSEYSHTDATKQRRCHVNTTGGLANLMRC